MAFGIMLKILKVSLKDCKTRSYNFVLYELCLLSDVVNYLTFRLLLITSDQLSANELVLRRCYIFTEIL